MQKICRRKFLVIDDNDLLKIDNLTRKVNQAVKHPEPVFKMDAPWNCDNEIFGWFNILYDDEDNLFKMWYTVDRRIDRNAAVIVDYPTKTAYATSTDGIHWDRPKLGLVEHNGSKKNNYILPEMGIYGISVIKDPSDTPARRYKMIFSTLGRESEWANFHIPLSLAYSADGIVWDRPTNVNPVIRGISDGPQSFFYDANRRKYVLLTRRVPNLPRDISQYESYDLVNWEDKGRVIVTGDRHDPPEMYNVYYMTPFLYDSFNGLNGLYLAMLNTMYTHPVSETYETYHKSPGYPDDCLGHLDIQLVFSRDGREWHRVNDRSPVISYGKPGEPDSGAVYPAKNPVVRNGETCIYYYATTQLHCWWHIWEQEKESILPRNITCLMLARMPEDHWVSLDAGSAEGYFLTKPWHMGQQMFVNADAKGGSIEVELITPYGEPVAGCTRAECVPITGNGKDQEVKWRSGRCGWDFIEKHKGGMLAKFYLKNAKLYSYSTTEPDPDGTTSRYWANANWLEHITHRSDNWGQKSNEPAKGLPPHP